MSGKALRPESQALALEMMVLANGPLGPATALRGFILFLFGWAAFLGAVSWKDYSEFGLADWSTWRLGSVLATGGFVGGLALATLAIGDARPSWASLSKAAALCLAIAGGIICWQVSDRISDAGEYFDAHTSLTMCRGDGVETVDECGPVEINDMATWKSEAVKLDVPGGKIMLGSAMGIYGIPDHMVKVCSISGGAEFWILTNVTAHCLKRTLPARTGHWALDEMRSGHYDEVVESHDLAIKNGSLHED
jgi:hypothetical protein